MAADTYTSRIGAILQGTGNNNNSWGANLNSGVINLFDRAIAGLYANTVTGGTLDLDDVIPPAGAHPLADMIVDIDGVLTSNQIILVPNVSKLWFVRNLCSGAFTLKFKTSAGSASAAIPQGGWCPVWCDGDDGFQVGLSTSLRDVQWLGADGTISAPGMSFAQEATLGWRRVSAGVIAVVVGGVDVMTISATGVNIGTGLALSVGGASVVPSGVETPFAGIRAPNGWYLEYGQTVTRSGDAALLAALTEGFTANTNNTVTLSNVSKDLRNLGLEGSVLEGVGIFTGATIVSVDSATQITMSAAATNTATGGAVTAFPHGNGDGSTTFTIPDGRGTTAAGRDNMGGTAANKLSSTGLGASANALKSIGGYQTITLDATQIPAHSHPNSLNDPGHNHTVSPSGQGAYPSQPGGDASASTAIVARTTSTNTTGITITNANNTGGGGAHSNVQPTRIRNIIIKR